MPEQSAHAISFGPIPSRRLGQSLGVNHIPPKHCTYACVYCQVHCVTRMETLRREYFPPAEVISDVKRRIAQCRRQQQRIDHVSFVPDGEPTLDANLGEELRAVRATGTAVAVITNGSLLWRTDVRRELADADLVSVKVDAVWEEPWRRINRPSAQLQLDWVLAGIADFARDYHGTLITETMLVAGANDAPAHIAAVADFVRRLEPTHCFLSVPTRPPFEPDVQPPGDDVVVRSWAIMRERIPNVELLGVEVPGEYGGTGDAVRDLLAILRIHPMLESAVRAFLERAGGDLAELQPLLESGGVERVPWRDEWFYTCRINPAPPPGVVPCARTHP